MPDPRWISVERVHDAVGTAYMRFTVSDPVKVPRSPHDYPRLCAVTACCVRIIGRQMIWVLPLTQVNGFRRTWGNLTLDQIHAEAGSITDAVRSTSA